MAANIIALSFPNLCKFVRVSAALGIVKHIKGDWVSLALRLGNNAVFLFCSLLDTRIMLCNPPQHICALSDINNFIIDLDAVYSRVFILCRKPFAF